jgi:hypothetical protein
MNTKEEAKTYKKTGITNVVVGIGFIALSISEEAPLSSYRFWLGITFLVIGAFLLKKLISNE